MARARPIVEALGSTRLCEDLAGPWRDASRSPPILGRARHARCDINITDITVILPKIKSLDNIPTDPFGLPTRQFVRMRLTRPKTREAAVREPLSRGLYRPAIALRSHRAKPNQRIDLSCSN